MGLKPLITQALEVHPILKKALWGICPLLYLNTPYCKITPCH